MKHVSSPSAQSLWSWESFFLGGGSILVWLLMWTFTDRSAPVHTVASLAFGLAFVVNHPHFTSSYVMMYSNYRDQLLKSPRHMIAGILVPGVLLGFIASSVFNGRADLMGQLVNVMYFLVGWHYVKQIFGCVIVTSARRKIYFSNLERRLVLANLFALWALSFTGGQLGGASYDFYGLRHTNWNLPMWTNELAMIMVGVTGCLAVAAMLRKYIHEGTLPSTSGMVAWVALYVWYLPALRHPSFAYLIPFFHSLQYLMFVWSFKSNQVLDQIRGLNGREARWGWVRGFVGYAATTLLLGALVFEWLPKGLDRQGWLSTSAAMGGQPFLVSFLVFINIHHYFIDNAIWRSSHDEVRKYLFAPPPVEEDHKPRVAA